MRNEVRGTEKVLTLYSSAIAPVALGLYVLPEVGNENENIETLTRSFSSSSSPSVLSPRFRDLKDLRQAKSERLERQQLHLFRPIGITISVVQHSPYTALSSISKIARWHGEAWYFIVGGKRLAMLRVHFGPKGVKSFVLRRPKLQAGRATALNASSPLHYSVLHAK